MLTMSSSNYKKITVIKFKVNSANVQKYLENNVLCSMIYV